MKLFSFLILLLIALSTVAQSNGNAMFDESYVHEIRVTFTQPDFFEILETYYATLQTDGIRMYLMADLQIDGVSIDSIGFREKGFLSNWGIFDESVKKPFKIDFNEFVSGKKYDGLKKLNLQNAFFDPSFMRDVVSYKMMRGAGIPAPRTSYARLYLNDEYWGLYIVAEQIDNKFLTNHFDDNDGNLFKCIDGTDLLYQGNLIEDYTDEFELKTNEEENDWSKFIALVETFNSDSTTFSNEVAQQFNIAGFSRVVAADMILKNWDSYHFNGRNFYLYSDPSTDLFHWIPWDYNLAISNFGNTLTFGAQDTESPNPLSDNFFGNADFTQNYYQDVCDLLHTTFNLEYIEPYIDAQAELIAEAIDEDFNKFYSTEAFEQNIDEAYMTLFGDVPGIKEFFATRQPELIERLEEVGFSCMVSALDELQSSSLSLYPNPTSGQLTTNHTAGGEWIEVYSITGTLLVRKAISGSTTQLDLSTAKPGIYLVSIITLSGRQTQKLQVY